MKVVLSTKFLMKYALAKLTLMITEEIQQEASYLETQELWRERILGEVPKEID
jgi:hypothetical protein